MADARHLRRKEKLMALFERHGMSPRVRWGQNFLLDKNQVNFIARTGQVGSEDIILEVGPGTGFLSKELAKTGATLIAVELDHGMAGLVQAEMKEFPNFFLIEADILAGKSTINPEVIARLHEMHEARGGVLKCISNLPYSAGTPFAANIFESDLPWHSGVYLLQLEVTERMVAKPGSKNYGSLSIKTAIGATKAKIERKVPPQVFWPRPKVDSGVIRVDFKPLAERMAIPWLELRQVCIAVFNSRRKSIRNALKGLIEKKEVLPFLEEVGVDPEIRGQNMTPEDFLKCAEHLKVSARRSEG